ncbi:MAG TPA: hypothetical protein PL105_25820, partial [Caldilineaceae bacterium]|nr:hypothetical protein [Caldilineaceae bacterium]
MRKNRTALFPFGSVTFYTIVFTAISLLTACGAATGPVAPPGKALETPITTESLAPNLQITPIPQPTQPTTATPEAIVEQIGIITFVVGDVFIEEASGKRASGMMRLLAQPGRVPTALEVIRNGTHLRVEAGGSVTIVCYNNRVVRITQRRTVQMTTAVCGEEGRQLPPRSAASVQPNNGTLATVAGSRRLSPESREKEGDYGKIAIIVAPRNTKIIEGDMGPLIQWVEVPGVSRYKLTVNGPVPLPDQLVTREEVACEDSGIGRIGTVCSLAWPLKEWPLVAGETYHLTIHSRVGIEWNLSEKSTIKTLAVEEAATIQAD